MQLNSGIRDLVAGGFVLAVGLLYGTMTLTGLSIGAVTDMGPGFFPLALSGLCMLIGLLIAGTGLVAARETVQLSFSLRPLVMLTLAAVVFSVTLRPAGLLVAVTLTTFISALADSKVRPVRAAVSSLVIAAFCAAVFVLLVGLQIPIIGPAFDMMRG